MGMQQYIYIYIYVHKAGRLPTAALMFLRPFDESFGSLCSIILCDIRSYYIIVV